MSLAVSSLFRLAPRLLAVWCVVAVLLAAARADDEPDLRRLFPHERDLFIERDGLVRLQLPPAVLAACRADLSDLRVFDQQEREIPYLIDAGLPAGKVAELVRSQNAIVIDAQRETIPREKAPPLHRETYVLALPPQGNAAWDLVFDVSRARFVRRLDVVAVAADGTTESLLAGGSLFRLPNPPAEKTRIALSERPVERLVVTIEGEEGDYLEPKLRFETARVFAPGARILVPLDEIARERREGRTIVDLVRPRGVVPDLLRIETETGSFNRSVEVWDEGLGLAARPLGRAQLFRVEGLVAAEEREVPVQPARGERLRVEIDDGDSGPLEGLRVSAVVRQPSLVFSLSGAGDAPAGRLRYGGGRAHAPRYDLAGLLPRTDAVLTGDRAEAAARLSDPAHVGPARLGDQRANPAYDGAPALAFAMRPGAALDPRAYTHRRPLAVRPSPDGLTRLRLTAPDVAQARTDLGDVRVVDADARQWPYLLRADAARGWEKLAVEGPERRRGISRYRLALSVTPLWVDQLVIESNTSFFDRGYRLTARRADDDAEVTLAAGRLAVRAERPRPVTIGFAPARITALELVVEDGDEAPLAFHTVRARVIEPELFLAAPAGEYALLVGNPDAAAPRYELERVRDVILAVGSGAAVAGTLAPNPDYRASARLATGERLEGAIPQIILWTVLIAAVVILTALTLRLARRDETHGGAS